MACRFAVKMRSRGVTSERCAVAGIYVTDCDCQLRQTMTEDTYFPSCFSCGKPVVWRLEDTPPSGAE